MDKNTTTGIILIVLLTFVWLWISQPEMPPEQIRQSEARPDSAAGTTPDSEQTPRPDLVAETEIAAEPAPEVAACRRPATGIFAPIPPSSRFTWKINF
ncbi:MAG: hypothetical protein H6628_12200 [Calditrichae bacterium]|nr:hypothetical protein [Calditrichia bacterium]